MITDGFLEWTNPDGMQYSDKRLVGLLRNHCDTPCNDLIQILYRDVLNFAGGTGQSDDLTVVVIRRAK